MSLQAEFQAALDAIGARQDVPNALNNLAMAINQLQGDHDALLAAVAPLLDGDVCQPFFSAWEFDAVREGCGGDVLHAQLKAAYEAVKR